MEREILQKALLDLQYAKKLISKGIDTEISKIELDIVLAKLRTAYELLAIQPEKPVKKVVPENTETTPQNETQQEIHIPVNKVVVERKEEIEEPEIKIIEPKIEDDPIIIIEKLKPEPQNELTVKTIEPTEASDNKQVADVLSEKYKSRHTPVNEVIASSMHPRDYANFLQTKPVKDIESVIDFNDKFLFIRELFNGDDETYLKTIRTLNTSSNFNEAFNYISQHFNWDMDSEAAHKLLDLVRRRFITTED